MLGWLAFYGAVCCGVGGATFLKLSDGMEKLEFVALSIASYVISFGFFAYALKTIPLGTAYAIWSGLGTLAIALIGIYWFDEPNTTLKWMFIFVIVIGCIGLNLLEKP